MKININTDGLITEIGFFDYQYNCPEFINFHNFHLMKCMDISNIEDETNWVEIEAYYEED
jgi:hypothetical protein